VRFADNPGVWEHAVLHSGVFGGWNISCSAIITPSAGNFRVSFQLSIGDYPPATIAAEQWRGEGGGALHLAMHLFMSQWQRVESSLRD
jgi:hypothetical protein